MGLRGPLGMSPEERAARGGRDRSKPGLPDATRRLWAARAEKLEQLGIKTVESASRLRDAKQSADKFSIGLKLLEAADKVWFRLNRIGPPPASSGPAAASSLAAFRDRKPRA